MNPEEKSRHCDLCSQSVYSLEDFEESEVVDLLQQKVCVRIRQTPVGRSKLTDLEHVVAWWSVGLWRDDGADPAPQQKASGSIQVTRGTVKVDLKRDSETSSSIGKIAPPTHQKKESVQGEVDPLHEELGEPMIEIIEQKPTTSAKEDCQTEEARDEE